jgi:hypothetical protein
MFTKKTVASEIEALQRIVVNLDMIATASRDDYECAMSKADAAKTEFERAERVRGRIADLLIT